MSEQPASQPIPGRKAILPGWMKSHMDRLNTVADLDDMCSSPPETESGFLRDVPLGRQMSHTGVNAVAPVLRVGGVKWEGPRLMVDESLQRQHGCRDSGSESCHTTPSATPQSSPSLVRRVVAADLKADLKALGPSQRPKRKARCAVSNFDLNAVSPTSW